MSSPHGPLLVWAIVGLVWQDLSGIMGLARLVTNFLFFCSFKIVVRNFLRAFCHSSKPAGNDVIGIDLGTTNSCVAVMDGKV